MMVAPKKRTDKVDKSDWKDKLVHDIEKLLDHSKVIIRERNLYEEELAGPDPFYEVIVIYPQFHDLEYHERLDMIWPIFAKLPNEYFKKIIGLDCVSPMEYHRRVA